MYYYFPLDFVILCARFFFLQFNAIHNAVVSLDAAGYIEYWSAAPEEKFEFPASRVKFQFKLDTDLFTFVKVSLNFINVKYKIRSQKCFLIKFFFFTI